MEGRDSNAGQLTVFAKGNALQAAATIEGIVINAGHTIRNGDSPQTGHVKGSTANASQTISNGYAIQTPTSFKGRASNAGHVISNSHISQGQISCTITGHKPVFSADRRNPIFNNNTNYFPQILTPGRTRTRIMIRLIISLRIPTGISGQHFPILSIQIRHTIRLKYQRATFILRHQHIRVIANVAMSAPLAGIGGITLCFICRLCHHSNIIMVQRITLCLAASKASFRLCAGRICPAMTLG